MALTEKEKRIRQCEATRRWREKHREEVRIKDREAQNKKNKTLLGRAQYLIRNYKKMDRKNGFGEVIDFDAQWLIENIMFKTCKHCGRSGWRNIGCNRIDNSKGHTKDNVEPCCRYCNSQLGGGYKKVGKLIDQIDPETGEVVKTWSSVREARRNGYHNCGNAANGKYKQANGYLWRYHK